LRRPKSPAAEDQKVLSWDELHVKLTDVADAYPSSPSSYGDPIVEERKHQEFVEHRKHHYNEMEMVRKFKEEHGGLLDDEDENNDADDDMDMM
jgi:Protein phosphatase inhibitor 2 (IPP-2)